jgi:DNA-binding transcriptional ArsR family regulator
MARAAPHDEPRLARVAAMLADASRARMLSYLLGGDLASAGELATAAAVSAPTASAHLARLLDAGLLVCEPRGRHRYYRLADADVAHALEALALVAERGSHARTWSSPARLRLRHARCCYGHLAGQAGVALLRGLVERRWLMARDDGSFAVTAAGADGLTTLGLDGAQWLQRSAGRGRGVAYGCLDWSERRDHLAGKLAAALLTHFLAQGWLRRAPGDRALMLTPPGRVALGAFMPLDAESAPPPGAG